MEENGLGCTLPPPDSFGSWETARENAWPWDTVRGSAWPWDTARENAWPWDTARGSTWAKERTQPWKEMAWVADVSPSKGLRMIFLLKRLQNKMQSRKYGKRDIKEHNTCCDKTMKCSSHRIN